MVLGREALYFVVEEAEIILIQNSCIIVLVVVVLWLNPITVCTPISKMASVYPTDPPRLVTPSTMPARW